jgi:hypothetical protein
MTNPIKPFERKTYNPAKTPEGEANRVRARKENQTLWFLKGRIAGINANLRDQVPLDIIQDIEVAMQTAIDYIKDKQATRKFIREGK